ncbi:MAG TPA: hypothetical protein VF516_21320 [Kofleriaceae bacterium]
MTEFNGIDIVVQHRSPDASVRRALAAALAVSEERVVVIDDLSNYPEAGAADIVCVSSALKGEFTGLLSIQVERLAVPCETHEQLMRRLCDALGTQCLVPDDKQDNPYLMWSISPGAAPRKIGLDPVAFDEGRYVIARNL